MQRKVCSTEEETKAVRHCANVIKSEFQDWIFKDPERREDLVKTYNEIYNSTDNSSDLLEKLVLFDKQNTKN